MATDRLVCSKCGREKPEKDFFKMKTGNRCDMCKVCLTAHIDNRKTDTFQWILEMFDVPYIEKKWVEMSNKIYLKDPAKFCGSSVIGQYLRSMNMKQWSEYGYADSDMLNFADRKIDQEAAARREQQGVNEQYEQELQEKLANGEISEAEYNTLTYTNAEEEATAMTSQVPQFVIDFSIDENEIAAQLQQEEVQYLMLKWGGHYRPSEWIAMEEMYNRYAGELDLNVDREETLKKMCRTSVKMDQALDIGDVSAYKAYSAVMKDLRTSGKFTEAQNKEDKVRYLDSIGELVALCEKEGGIIEQYKFDPDEYPQDKVDFTLKDLKSYTYNLVTNELGLGDLIESYIKKLEESEKAGDDLDLGLITSAEEEAKLELTDEEAYEFQDWLESDIERDAELLLKAMQGQECGDGFI